MPATRETTGSLEDREARWAVALIDHWELRRGSEPVSTTHAVQRVCALLAICGRHDRSWVAGQLWPEGNERHAQGNLRSALWRIRQQHPGLIDTSDGTIALDRTVTFDVDEIQRFAHAVLEDGVVPTNAVSTLSAGELLPGWYEDWVLLHRERLHQIQLHALERVAVLLARDGHYVEALQAGLTAVRMDPLRESSHRVVASVHLAEGNAGEAIRQFDACRRLLADELGIPPTRHFLNLMDHLLPAVDRVRVGVAGRHG